MDQKPSTTRPFTDPRGRQTTEVATSDLVALLGQGICLDGAIQNALRLPGAVDRLEGVVGRPHEATVVEKTGVDILAVVHAAQLMEVVVPLREWLQWAGGQAAEPIGVVRDQEDAVLAENHARHRAQWCTCRSCSACVLEDLGLLVVVELFHLNTVVTLTKDSQNHWFGGNVIRYSREIERIDVRRQVEQSRTRTRDLSSGADTVVDHLNC